MDEVLEVLGDWDRLTDELAARSIATDVAWTVMGLVAQRRVAAALERLAAIHGGQLNRDTLNLVPDPSGLRVHPDLARPGWHPQEPVVFGHLPDGMLDHPHGVMNSASLALVFRARELLRQYATQPDLIEAEELLTRALANGVDADEDPGR